MQYNKKTDPTNTRKEQKTRIKKIFAEKQIWLK